MGAVFAAASIVAFFLCSGRGILLTHKFPSIWSRSEIRTALGNYTDLVRLFLVLNGAVRFCRFCCQQCQLQVARRKAHANNDPGRIFHARILAKRSGAWDSARDKCSAIIRGRSTKTLGGHTVTITLSVCLLRCGAYMG